MYNYTILHLHSDLSNGVTNIDSVTKYNQYIEKEYRTVVDVVDNGLFDGWHNKEYLRVCVCNIYEKYKYGLGKSKVTEKEWNTLLDGYKNITGEDYVV